MSTLGATGFVGSALTPGVAIALAVLAAVALAWVVVAIARLARSLRAEVAALHVALEGLRREQPRNRAAAPANGSDIAARLADIAEAQRRTERTLSQFLSLRPSPAPAMPPAPGPGAQAALALGTPDDDGPPLTLADFTAALQFPTDQDDRDGFRALRLAMRDRRVGPLVTAAQDVLTLFSHDGLYMDDLHPDAARPEVWRRFAGGARGQDVATLGGIRDRAVLSAAASRMRGDIVFRDAAHHFLRLFDRTFAAVAPNATDAEIAAIADTRTARAFMLLGRVAGSFD